MMRNLSVEQVLKYPKIIVYKYLYVSFSPIGLTAIFKDFFWLEVNWYHYILTGKSQEKKDENLESSDKSFCTEQNEGTKC